MLEVECKFALADVGALEASLQPYGTLGEAVHEIDIFYAHPNRDFVATDEALRWRLPQRILTYKGAKLPGRAKAREEIELRVDDPSRMLAALGFRAVARLEKMRRTLRLPDLTITLDHIPGLGDFVELEILATDAALAEPTLLQWQERLGIVGEPILASYLELRAKRE